MRTHLCILLICGSVQDVRSSMSLTCCRAWHVCSYDLNLLLYLRMDGHARHAKSREILISFGAVDSVGASNRKVALLDSVLYLCNIFFADLSGSGTTCNSEYLYVMYCIITWYPYEHTLTAIPHYLFYCQMLSCVNRYQLEGQKEWRRTHAR